MLESKRQLRANRRHALNAWLVSQDMRMDEAGFWSTEQRDAEAATFARLDADYEDAKAALQADLEEMPAGDRATWFVELGWDPIGTTDTERIDDYLDRA